MKAPTTDEWIAELERIAQGVGADGMPVSEIAATIGCGPRKAREMVKKAILVGAWECAGQQYRQTMAGKMQPVPVYRPKK